MSEPQIRIDDDGTVVAAGEDLLRWIGRSRDDVVGRVTVTDLIEDLLQARADAELAADRLHVLQRITSALAEAVGIDGVVAAVLDAVVGPLGAAAGTVWLYDAEDGLVAHDSSGEHMDEAGVPLPGPLLQAREVRKMGERYVVPLHGLTPQLQGLLSVAPGAPLDPELLATVGKQAGLALERAHLFERSAHVAQTLQLSLLGDDAPVDPRFDAARMYLTGEEGLVVGGDWYDLFFAEPNSLSIVVGDVVGRGLSAAIAMGQLRSAVRALAAPTVDPARLLGRLDRFVEQSPGAAVATLVYASLELDTGVLRHASAGHLPPLLLPCEGEPRFLWDGRSTPLGARFDEPPRTDAAVQLQPGDRVLLYTDGLVERRRRDLDDGLHLLRDAAHAVRDGALQEVARAVTSLMLRDDPHPDDVCVLLVAWHGDRRAAAPRDPRSRQGRSGSS